MLLCLCCFKFVIFNFNFNLIFFSFRTVSGTVEDQCQTQRNVNEYGFCDCVELVPDYYDEDFVDLIELDTDLIRGATCPPDQGRRCYIQEPLLGSPTSSRIFFGK